MNLQSNGPTVGVYPEGKVIPELVPDARCEDPAGKHPIQEISSLMPVVPRVNRSVYFSTMAAQESSSAADTPGFSNPFEIAALIQTKGEGLAVCGTTGWLDASPDLHL